MKRPTIRWLFELLNDGWYVVVARPTKNRHQCWHVWAHPASTWLILERSSVLGSASDWQGVLWNLEVNGRTTEWLEVLANLGMLRLATFAEARRILGRRAERFIGPDRTEVPPQLDAVVTALLRQ